MRKRIVRIWDVPLGSVLTALGIIAAAFSLGALAGMLLVSQVGGSGHDSLSAYLESYLRAAQAGTAAAPGLAAILWETIRWPLFTFLMGFTALGAVGVPVLFAARGFLLSFAVSSFVRMFGGAGAILAFFSFGLTGMVAIPTLFVLGVQSFAAAHKLAVGARGGGKRPVPFGQAYLIRSGLCAAALGLCVLMECWAVPALLRSVAGLF